MDSYMEKCRGIGSWTHCPCVVKHPLSDLPSYGTIAKHSNNTVRLSDHRKNTAVNMV